MDFSDKKLMHHHNCIIDVWSSEQYTNVIEEISKDTNVETLLDLGANTGAVVEVLAKKLPLKKVVCFEPARRNFEVLEERMKLLQSDNVECINIMKAVFYGEEKIEAFGVGDGNTGGMFLRNVAAEFGPTSNYNSIQSTGLVFDCTTLEASIPNLQFDLAKIDVEGSEWNIFENSKFIKENVKNILFEFHWLSLQQSLEFCQKHLPNFRLMKFVNPDVLWLKRI